MFCSIKLITSFCLVVAVIAQDYQDYQPARPAPVRIQQGNGAVDTRPTPVAILKQINRHNEDGSYTYGYEGGDGSFKIETKSPTGEVKGKYGYVDETGKVRVVEYGADKYGFQPSGEGITVAPPTLIDETNTKDRLVDYEDEQPQPKPYIARVPRPQQQARPAPIPQRPQYVDYDEPQPRPQQISRPQSIHRPQYSDSPVPPRAQIPGAAPVNDVVYSPQPRPARPDPEYTQTQTFAGFGQGPAPVSAPRLTQPSYIAPVHRQQEIQYSAPRPAPTPVSYARPQPTQGRSTSVLDQLAKDYALPQGGAAPLHDITFGYY